MIRKFNVVPYLPEKLAPLMEIAQNMWWVWNFEAIELFRRLDVDLWREVEHNPVKMLGTVPQKILDEMASSESFLAHMNQVYEEMKWHMSRRSWFDEDMSSMKDSSIVYFSAEFGIHESLPIYSGGLGVLAGDHLKSASELGLPLYGVGLLYRMGYFRQYLNMDGWQQERFPETDFHTLPVQQVMKDGEPLVISVEYPGRNVYARVWKIQVGRVELYLLDTNIDQNNADDRAITDQLYGGDSEMRIKQEIMLGVGGIRALKAMDKKVTVYHMNEGHAAFMGLERTRCAMKDYSLSFREAMEFVSNSSVFTTHTPVPAGNDRFNPEMIDTYFSHFYNELGITRDEFLGLGRENVFDKNETFCMTVLAIKMAAHCNGVSKLHGVVSRNMWKNVWDSLPEHEVPIGHVTNGIQTLSWTSDEMMRLFNRYLGPRWIDNPADNSIWEHIDKIPDSELWRSRVRLRERLIAFSRKKLRDQLLSRGIPLKEADRAGSVLDPEALTIGFARRFATYKRGTLIFSDLDRLAAILNDRERPVQIIFAGKAHPRDHQGKDLIRQLIHIGQDERFRDRILFLEDYEINIARYMVQGVDVWLNNPIRPKEASGTSGMKVIPNGGLNISILDGWWDEACDSGNGWAIGKGEEYEDRDYQDEVESTFLYNLLEKEVVPAFFNRGADGLPHEWLARIRHSMKTINAFFNTNRMVRDYTEMYYSRAHSNFLSLVADNFSKTKDLASWKKKIHSGWKGVKILDADMDDSGEVTVGSQVKVKARIDMGSLKPEDAMVELYFGSIDPAGNIIEGASLPMSLSSEDEGGVYTYEGQMLCLRSGQFGFTVRIVPHHESKGRKFCPDLPVTWG